MNIAERHGSLHYILMNMIKFLMTVQVRRCHRHWREQYMKLLQKSELINIRNTMYSNAMDNETFGLALMIDKYADAVVNMMSGSDVVLDAKIIDVAMKLKDIADSTRDGELEAGHSYYLSCAYVDTLVTKVISPWFQTRYGEKLIPYAVISILPIIGEA